MKKLFLLLCAFAGTLSFSLEAKENDNDSIKVNSQGDLDAALKKNDAVVVKFMANWCGVCKNMKELDQHMRNEFKDTVAFVEIDSDKSPDLAKAYNVNGIPTYNFFKKGSLVDSQIGKMKAKHFRKKIKKLL